jgi:terminase, large subunit
MNTLSLPAKTELMKSLEKLRIRIPMLPWQFADKHFYLPPESSGISGRWTSYPYQRGIINLCAGTSAYKVVFFKPRRSGFTKIIEVVIVCLGADRCRKIGVWHPRAEDSIKFQKIEIVPLFDHVKVFRDALRTSHELRNKDVTLKQINLRGSMIVFNSAMSANNSRQLTLDCVIGDEVDAFSAEVDNEGDVISLMEGRTEQSPYRKVILGSTCTVEGSSIIEREYNATEIKLRRFVPCPHCAELQILEWENFKYEKNATGTQAVNAWFVCKKCSEKIEYRHYQAMDEGGEWMSEDKTVWYDDATDSFFKCGEGYLRKVRSVGIHLWSAYSHFKTWIDLATEWIEANNAAALGDRGKLVTFINQCLSRTTKESSARFSPSVFDGKREDFDYQNIPKDVDFLTAGIDVQRGINERLEIVIVGTSKTKDDLWIIRHVVVDGDISKKVIRDEINEKLFDLYRREDGLTMQVIVALMDEGDGVKTNAVRQWSAENAHYEKAAGALKRAYRTSKGVGAGPAVHAMKWYGETPNPRAKCHHVNQTSIKDILYRKAVLPADKPGGIHLCKDIGEEWIKQFFGEKRTVERRNGKTTVKYQPISNGQAVEALDCTVYGYAAAIIAKNSRAE